MSNERTSQVDVWWP